MHASNRQPRSFLFKSLSPFLFFAPATYLASLEHVWVDKRVSNAVWKSFIGEMDVEWKELILVVRDFSLGALILKPIKL